MSQNGDKSEHFTKDDYRDVKLCKPKDAIKENN